MKCVFWVGVGWNYCIDTFDSFSMEVILRTEFFESGLAPKSQNYLFIFRLKSFSGNHSHLKIWCVSSILVLRKWYKWRSKLELSILSVVIKRSPHTGSFDLLCFYCPFLKQNPIFSGVDHSGKTCRIIWVWATMVKSSSDA